MILRRYAHLALTCREMRCLVVTEALPLLVPRVQPLISPRLLAAQPVRATLALLCQEPSRCSLAELKVRVECRSNNSTVAHKRATLVRSGATVLQAACRVVGVVMGKCNKPELIVRLLRFLGVAKPTPVPPDLLLAVACAPPASVPAPAPGQPAASQCLQSVCPQALQPMCVFIWTRRAAQARRVEAGRRGRGSVRVAATWGGCSPGSRTCPSTLTPSTRATFWGRAAWPKCAPTSGR